MNDDLKIAQLVSSRICHDLASAAVAVNAGLELLEEHQGNDPEALGLVETGAQLLNNRLSFFRAAFGQTGEKSVAETRDLAMRYLVDGKARLQWSVSANVSEQGRVTGFDSRVTLLLILLASEALLRGGDITVQVAVLPEGCGVAVNANGEGARLRDEIKTVFIESPGVTEVLTPRNIHGYCLFCLLNEMNTSIETEFVDNSVRFAVLLPGSSK